MVAVPTGTSFTATEIRCDGSCSGTTNGRSRSSNA
jgi:hypothetical protein